MTSDSEPQRRLALTKQAAVLAFLAATAALWPVSQVSAHQPLKIVDFPTAGLPEKGQYGVDLDLYSDGGLLAGLEVGFFSFLSFGISYGGIGFIGTGDMDMNPRPEVNARVRILNEDIVMPAIAVGFDSQGYGRFYDDAERYLVKSRGLYAVASKNWDLAGPFSLHGGVSYSFEDSGDRDPTVFLGAIKTFANLVEFSAEFDVAANDNEGSADIVESRPYVNASIAWYVHDNFSLALDFRDIASSSKKDSEGGRKWNRGLSLTYRAEI